MDNAAVERFMRPPVVSIAVARATAIEARISVTGVVCEVSQHKSITNLFSIDILNIIFLNFIHD